MSGNTAILLLAYGTPERPDDIEPYFTHIRGGRRPSPAAVAELTERYALVGGRTPLLDVTRALAEALEQQLATGDRVFVAMKHWHPFIADVVPQIAAAGVDRVIAIVLAPHYSRMSIGGYRRALEDANSQLASPLDVQFVDHWHLHPSYIGMVADRIRQALRNFPEPGERVMTLFSAHSLPARIREWGDPYEAQLIQSCAAVAHQAGLPEWRFAWQSAGHTAEPWLGPDIVEYLESLHGEGIRRVLSVPVGFLSEHLEVLYDIDHEARGRAEALGMVLRRIDMPNASPAMVDTLAALVQDVRRGALGEPLAPEVTR